MCQVVIEIEEVVPTLEYVPRPTYKREIRVERKLIDRGFNLPSYGWFAAPFIAKNTG